MTIAVGVVARSGVVLAADSQETIQGYWKSNQGKISWSGYYGPLQTMEGRSAGVCAMACAGRSTYCEAMTADVLSAFNADPDAINEPDVQRLVRQQTLDFHRLHVVPYSDMPEVQGIFGYFRNNRFDLFQTDRGVVRRNLSYAAVGLGASEAQAFLSRAWKLPVIDMRTAIVFAAYAVFLAKERIDGCGSFTDIVYLHGHQRFAVPRTTVERLEKVFRRYVQYVELPVLLRALGSNTPMVNGLSEAVEVIRRDIEGVDLDIQEGQTSFNPEYGQAIHPPSRRGRKRRPPSPE